MRRHARVGNAGASGVEDEEDSRSATKREAAALHAGDDIETEDAVVKSFRRLEVARVNGGFAELTEQHEVTMRSLALRGKSRLPLRLPNTRLSDRMPEIGKMLVVFGAVIALLGLALWSGVGAGWLGRLPGDIRIERGHSAFYFPIVTCIIISILLSLLLSLFRR